MILNFNTIMQATVMTSMLRNAEQSSAKMLNKSHAIIGGGKPWVLVVQVIVWLACFGSVVWLFFWHDSFKDENILVRQWIEIEMLIFLLEMPF